MANVQSGWEVLDRHTRIAVFASIFEGTFSIDWLIELTNEKVSIVLEALKDLVNQGLITCKDTSLYFFTDSGKRAELQKLLPLNEKKGVHRRIVEIICKENLVENDLYIAIAWQLMNLSCDVNDCRWLLEAAKIYRQKGQWKNSSKFLLKVISDLNAIGSEEAAPLFIKAVIEYSKDYNNTRDPSTIAAYLEDALKLAEKLRDIKRLAILEMIVANTKWIQNEYDVAIEHYRQGAKLADSVVQPEVQRALLKANCFYHYWCGRFRDTVEIFEKFGPKLEDHYSFDPRSLQSGIVVGVSYAFAGHTSQGIGMVDGILKHSLEIGLQGTAALAGACLGLVLSNIYRDIDAVEVLKDSLKYEKQQITFSKFWGHYHLAYAYYRLNNHYSSVHHLKEVLKIREKLGFNVRFHPFLLEICWAMEYGDFPSLNGLSFDKELELSLKANSILVRGVAHRYRAFVRKKINKPKDTVLGDLVASFELISKSGHQVELARTAIELCLYYRDDKNDDKAKEYAKIAAVLAKGLKVKLLPKTVSELLEDYTEKDSLLEQIMTLGSEIVSIRDSNELLKHLISTVNRLTGAERGAIFFVDKKESPGECSAISSINLPLKQIMEPSFRSSLELVKSTASSGKGVVRSEANRKQKDGFTENTIKSVISIPLIVKGNVIGVLYHDNRIYRSVFNEKDLEVLKYFGTLAAIALDNARAYEEIKRLNRKLSEETEYYKTQHVARVNFDDFVGASPAIKKVLTDVENVAKTDANVLILGETGVGKEMVAQAVHRHSPRNSKPFVAAQCATFPRELVSSELFGHEKASFTGAENRRIGRFELANGGTVFLDEIGDISLEVQVRLLRVLQSHTFERVGGRETIHSDFRLVAATNRNLAELVKKGEFRSDLYYRLNVFCILVPPLRERKEDIPVLAEFFLEKYAKKLGKSFRGISQKDMEKLINYSWPGNVRELENVIERGTILNSGPSFYLPELVAEQNVSALTYRGQALGEVEKRHIIRTLETTGWKVYGKRGAAEILEINHNTLYSKIRKYGIKRPD